MPDAAQPAMAISCPPAQILVSEPRAGAPCRPPVYKRRSVQLMTTVNRTECALRSIQVRRPSCWSPFSLFFFHHAVAAYYADADSQQVCYLPDILWFLSVEFFTFDFSTLYSNICRRLSWWRRKTNQCPSTYWQIMNLMFHCIIVALILHFCLSVCLQVDNFNSASLLLIYYDYDYYDYYFIINFLHSRCNQN